MYLLVTSNASLQSSYHTVMLVTKKLFVFLNKGLLDFKTPIRQVNANVQCSQTSKLLHIHSTLLISNTL